MRDDSALTAPIAFIMAGMLAVGAIGVLALNTGDVANSAQTAPARTENLRGQAESLLDLLLLSPGYVGSDGPYGYAKCNGDPQKEWDGLSDGDCVERLGLLDTTQPYLNISKFRNLKSSPYKASGTDAFVNYVEARSQFGLDDQHLGFHVRSYPTLQSVQDILACKEVDGTNPCRDPNLRVTYIGNLDETGGEPFVHSPRCEKSPWSDSSWRFSVLVRNDGTTTTQFQGIFEFSFDNTKVTRKDQSGLVDPPTGTDPGETVELWVDVENQDFDCNTLDDGTTTADTQMTVSVYDASKALTSSPTGEFDVANGFFTSSSGPSLDAPQAFYVELDDMRFAAGDAAVVGYSGAAKDEVLDWEAWTGTDKSGIMKASGSHTVPTSKPDQHIDIDTTGWDEGQYTVNVTHAPTGIVSTQRLLINNTVVADYTTMGSSSSYDVAMEVEVGFFHDLVEKFCPAFYDDPADGVLPTWTDGVNDPEEQDTFAERCDHRPVDVEGEGGGSTGEQQWGDVFWDDKSVLTDDVCKRLQYVQPSNGNCQTGNTPRLDITNTLVVGSNVDHNALTSGGFKWPLRDWVEAGGTLIVFGSPETATQWIQPIFNVGESSSSGGVSAPDLNHPLLAVPDQLSYDEYENQGKGWHYTGGSEKHFTNVTKQGDDPITAISDPGAFGKGTVIITTWLPYDLFGDGPGTADAEGFLMVNNFLMQGYRDLFLDYGPEIPEGVEVLPAFKRAQIKHEDIGLVDLDIALYVFPDS